MSRLSGTRALILSATLAALPLSGSQAATPPQMKMTTPIPEGIATPDSLQTSIGTLTSFDGVPDQATT